MQFAAEYYPRGPSDSSAVRAIAESRYMSLISSAAMHDRKKFIEWTKELNSELLEIPRKEIFRQLSPEKVQMAHSHRNLQREGAEIHSPITEDMKIASLSSLEKIRRRREQYGRFVIENAENEDPDPRYQKSEISSTKVLGEGGASHILRAVSIEDYRSPTVMDTRSLDGNGISQMAEPTDMLGEHLNSSSRPLMSNTFSPRVSSEEPSVVLRVATDDVAARAVMAELDLSGKWRSSRRCDTFHGPVQESVDLSGLTLDKVSKLLSGGNILNNKTK